VPTYRSTAQIVATKYQYGDRIQIFRPKNALFTLNYHNSLKKIVAYDKKHFKEKRLYFTIQLKKNLQKKFCSSRAR